VARGRYGRRVVDHRRGARRYLQLGGAAVEGGRLLGHAQHLFAQNGAVVVLDGAQGAAEGRGRRDHVVRLAALHAAERQYGGVARVGDAPGQLVERLHDLAGDPDGVDRLVRAGAVAGAAPVHGNVETVAGGGDGAGLEAVAPGFERGIDVNGVNGVDPVQHARVDHQRRPAGDRLLVGLKEDARPPAR
jgi:hypothetical protein